MASDLLTADQVSDRLGVDRSTVYRMAMDGRLEAVKVGRQWRFPTSVLPRLGSTAPPPVASQVGHAVPQDVAVQVLLDVTAEALGVMLLLTDMDGAPISAVANPCPWFEEHGHDDGVLDSCRVQWRDMADDPVMTPRLELGDHGFECARGFVRSGDRLVGMVLAGGVAPVGTDLVSARAAGLHHLDADRRARLLQTLPRLAAALSTLSATSTGSSS